MRKLLLRCLNEPLNLMYWLLIQVSYFRVDESSVIHTPSIIPTIRFILLVPIFTVSHHPIIFLFWRLYRVLQDVILSFVFVFSDPSEMLTITIPTNAAAEAVRQLGVERTYSKWKISETLEVIPSSEVILSCLWVLRVLGWLTNQVTLNTD